MSEDSELMTLNEVTTHNGTVRIGDHFHDKRTHNRRWLRVDRIETDRYGTTVHSTVVHQEHPDGRVTQPMRATTMTPDRLLGATFLRCPGPGQTTGGQAPR